jgi:hypothetical protein
MTAYRVNDVPANPVVFEIVDDIPVAGYTSAAGVLSDPAGAVIPLTGATFTLGSETDDDDPEPIITVSWGSVTPFALAGLYQLAVTLHGAAGAQAMLPNFPIIVEAEDGWLTMSSLRRNWRDAPVDDEDVFELLSLSRAAVIEFAPVLAEGAIIPANYRKGQRMQARNTWNAAVVDPSNGQIGDDTFVIRPYPLDWSVKQILRPKPAVPWVG